jgi:hypothetical protein
VQCNDEDYTVKMFRLLRVFLACLLMLLKPGFDVFFISLALLFSFPALVSAQAASNGPTCLPLQVGAKLLAEWART